MARQKKEKIVWVDDGRTIADMSAVGRKSYPAPSSEKHGKPLKASTPLKEQLRTFFDAMGFMFLPTLAMVGMLIVVFLLVYLIL